MTQDKLPNLNAIDGLKWAHRWRMTNDPSGLIESYVVPFPQTRPFNVVFHGDHSFEYGHYGIHLGQEDQLTFLGNSEQYIHASFYDSRKNSSTFGVKISVAFPAGSGHTLSIPPGVAHKFSNLEKIVTINNYKIFLPKIDQWESHLKFWNPKADVINLTDEEIEKNIPSFNTNSEPASDTYYQMLTQKNSKGQSPSTRFPEVFQIQTDKENRWARVREYITLEKNNNRALVPIEGCYWSERAYISTGEESGIVPFATGRPFYIVDHGFTHYSNDTFGIHLGQEDQLTFIGPSNHTFAIELVDARKNSSTRGVLHRMSVHPSAIHTLIIPSGIAHRFLDIEHVFTINTPTYRVQSALYRPGNDTLDWNPEREPLPELVPHSVEASSNFYLKQMKHQTKMMKQNKTIYSPTGYLTKTKTGKSVKLVFRKKKEP